MDSDFESELKERETIVDDLKKLETEKVRYFACCKTFLNLFTERLGAGPCRGEKRTVRVGHRNLEKQTNFELDRR